MTQPIKTPSDSKSEQEVSKQGNLQTPAKKVSKQRTGSKYSAEYWRDRIVRPTYTRDGETREVQQWHAQIQAGGRRQRVGLNTNNREEAARTAARLYGEITSKGWEPALAAFDPTKVEKTDCVTVGDFIEAVEAAGTGLAPRSLRGYVGSFRWIVAAVFGIEGDKTRFDYKGDGNRRWREKIDRKRMDALTPEKIQHALDRYIAKAGASPAAQQRAKRSVASVARQARALFAPKAVKRLPFKRLTSPFDGIEIEGQNHDKPRYSIPVL